MRIRTVLRTVVIAAVMAVLTLASTTGFVLADGGGSPFPR